MLRIVSGKTRKSILLRETFFARLGGGHNPFFQAEKLPEKPCQQGRI